MTLNKSKDLYESDNYAWLLYSERQAMELGLEEMKQFLDEMSRSKRRELKSYLRVLIAHLLKWKYQPDHQSSSWRASIRNSRHAIFDLLEESPSLKTIAYELATAAYDSASEWAEEETKLNSFPKELEFTLEQLLNKDFFPN